jgi:hypothetical protein
MAPILRNYYYERAKSINLKTLVHWKLFSALDGYGISIFSEEPDEVARLPAIGTYSTMSVETFI